MNHDHLVLTRDILRPLAPITICIVCGYDLIDEYPWGKEGNMASYEICDCCGTQFGYHDNAILGVYAKRLDWIEIGFKWHFSKYMAKDWDPITQLSGIPSELFDSNDGKEQVIAKAKEIYNKLKSSNI